jgi:hypothetical protein
MVGVGRDNAQKRILNLRDSILKIKRYLYRRILSGAFTAEAGSDKFSKEDLRRFSVWLFPFRVTAPTKTERICFNSTFNFHHRGLGSPAVTFPPANGRTEKDYFSGHFWPLKSRILLERRFPVRLLDELIGKRTIVPSDQLEFARSYLKVTSGTRFPSGSVFDRAAGMAQWQI